MKSFIRTFTLTLSLFSLNAFAVDIVGYLPFLDHEYVKFDIERYDPGVISIPANAKAVMLRESFELEGVLEGYIYPRCFLLPKTVSNKIQSIHPSDFEGVFIPGMEASVKHSAWYTLTPKLPHKKIKKIQCGVHSYAMNPSLDYISDRIAGKLDVLVPYSEE